MMVKWEKTEGLFRGVRSCLTRQHAGISFLAIRYADTSIL
jgi:hypothetical protein